MVLTFLVFVFSDMLPGVLSVSFSVVFVCVGLFPCVVFICCDMICFVCCHAAFLNKLFHVVWYVSMHVWFSLPFCLLTVAGQPF